MSMKKKDFFMYGLMTFIVLLTFIQSVNGALTDNLLISNNFENSNTSLSNYGINATYSNGNNRITSQYYDISASLKLDNSSTSRTGLWFPNQFNRDTDFTICAYVNISNSSTACSNGNTGVLFSVNDKNSQRISISACSNILNVNYCRNSDCWVYQRSSLNVIHNEYIPLCFIYNYTSSTNTQYILNYNNISNSTTDNYLLDNIYSTGISIGSASVSGATFSNNATYFDCFNVWNKSLNSSEITEWINNCNYPFLSTSVPIFINQTPSDITSTNAIGVPVIIYYNYNTLNSSNATLEYGHKGMSEIINGTLQPYYYNKSYKNVSGSVVSFVVGDNDVYGYTGNIDEHVMESTSHGLITMTGITDVIKTQILNVSNTLNYNILEIMLNSTNNINVYYCNSSYSTGNPSTNNNCALIQSGTYTGFNHSVNYSRHNVFSMPIISRNIGLVNVTSTSYIVVKPLVLQTAQIGYINGSVRNNMLQISGNGGLTYSTDNTKIPDMHIHQYLGTGTGNENFTYRAHDLQGNYSVYQVDAIGLTNLPPTTPQIYDIDDKTYNQTINVTWINSSANAGSKINQYTINIVNSSFDVVLNGGANDSTNTKIFNSTSLKYGVYYAKVTAIDNNSLTSTGYSNGFIVQSLLYEPCNSSIVSNSTGVTLFFNWSTTSPLITDTTIKGVYQNISTEFTTDTQGDNTFVGFNNGVYYLYINQTYNDTTQAQYYSECLLNVCVNTWTKQNLPCVSNLRLINYTYSCSTPYDYPSDYGTYEDCQLPANTDRELWFIIILLVLWICSLIVSTKIPLITLFSFIIGAGLTYYMTLYFTSGGVLIGFVVLATSVLFCYIGIKYK